MSVKSIKTLPHEVIQRFVPFRYLIVDSGHAQDFTHASHCCVCSISAIPNDSVECSTCSRVYHMQCLNPPMLRKLGKGFAWSCLTCLNGTSDYPAEKEVQFNFQIDNLPPLRTNVDPPIWPYCYVGDFSRVREAICTSFFDDIN